VDRRRFLGLASLTAASISPRLDAVPIHVVQDPQWRPDGVGNLARLGILTPDFDPVPESEMSAMAPAGVSIHASRVQRNKTPAAFAEPLHIDVAAERLIDLAPRAVVFAYTGSSYVLGPAADAPTRARLEGRLRGIPVVMTGPAAADALRVLSVRRVALVHPPWFSEETNAKGMEYFRELGFEVLSCERLAPARAFTEVRPAETYDWVRSRTPQRAEAVFIGGNGIRAVGAIHALETALGRPVLTANQVALWAALRVAKIRVDISNYGRIFAGG
jgi:maleate isomerase